MENEMLNTATSHLLFASMHGQICKLVQPMSQVDNKNWHRCQQLCWREARSAPGMHWLGFQPNLLLVQWRDGPAGMVFSGWCCWGLCGVGCVVLVINHPLFGGVHSCFTFEALIKQGMCLLACGHACICSAACKLDHSLRRSSCCCVPAASSVVLPYLCFVDTKSVQSMASGVVDCGPYPRTV